MQDPDVLNFQQVRLLYLYFLFFKGEACLWSDIKSNPQLPNASPDKKLSDERTKYLMKVIAEAIEKFASGKDSVSISYFDFIEE